jgi:nicotinamidase-related amidase
MRCPSRANGFRVFLRFAAAAEPWVRIFGDHGLRRQRRSRQLRRHGFDVAEKVRYSSRPGLAARCDARYPSLMAIEQPQSGANALLVIDVQDSFKVGARWELRNNPNFEANLKRLVDAFRASRQLVIFFLTNDADKHFNAESPAYRVMSFLSPRQGEPTIHKYSYNCFTTTNLQALLSQNGVRTVTIAGIKTEQCCETTARVACDLGFSVDFVTEATMTFPISRANGRGELSCEDIVERTECVLRDRFARIRTVDEVIADLKPPAIPMDVRPVTVV